MKQKITVGILAHVDAGKTTLSEALLYRSGKLRTLGRVDHGSTFLDTNAVERERGITIFSKQARFSTAHCDFILLDTPGHVDFSPEAERTLSLLDYAILVVSASDGVQNHTRTLWQLLEFYGVPTFIFVNKMDLAVESEEAIADALAKALSPACIAFSGNESTAFGEQFGESLREQLALVSDDLLEKVLSDAPIGYADLAPEITRRRLFPCFFGSALRTTGIDRFLDALDRLTLAPLPLSEELGARVYKIARVGALRLTYMKITGGTLSVRDEITYRSADGRRVSEKVSQLRLYSGEKFEQVDSVSAGEICAAVGLSATYVGQGLGMESDAQKPILEPVIGYRIRLPEGCDPILYFPKLKELEEEEPSLHLTYNAELSEIEARLMGDIQIDLLRRMISDRFSILCEIDEGSILYQERIAGKTVGVGHFEPLRHYAEVQLLMEPQPKGTGLIFDTKVPEGTLDASWQRLVLSHLYEKNHRGVLIGAPLTDTKITLVAGRAHLKHTEGGDFREATLRAVRQGLMKAGCILLEPYYRFRLSLPSSAVGRAMSDLTMRSAEFEVESATDGESVIVGRAPVRTLHGYARDVLSYTRGAGRLSCTPDGCEPCPVAEEIVRAAAYDPEADLENTPHSVFCAHGAGVTVPWNEVDAHKHLDASSVLSVPPSSRIPTASGLARRYSLSDEELEKIMLREFGPIKRRRYTEPKTVQPAKTEKTPHRKPPVPQRHLLIIDGYNLIYAWEDLKAIASHSLESARDALMDLLDNYVAYTRTELVLVFDAYLVKGGSGSEMKRGGYRVVFTRQDQTADAYIERLMYELGPNYNVKVVTGDRLLQLSAVHSGILRMTAREFEDEVTRVGNEISEFIRRFAETKSEFYNA